MAGATDDGDSADRLRQLVNDWDLYSLRLDHDQEWRDEMRRPVVIEMRVELEKLARECGLG